MMLHESKIYPMLNGIFLNSTNPAQDDATVSEGKVLSEIHFTRSYNEGINLAVRKEANWPRYSLPVG